MTEFLAEFLGTALAVICHALIFTAASIFVALAIGALI